MTQFHGTADEMSEIFCESRAQNFAISPFMVKEHRKPGTAQFRAAAFASMKPEEFRCTATVGAHKDFREYREKPYRLLPSPPLQEADVPVSDWE